VSGAAFSGGEPVKECGHCHSLVDDGAVIEFPAVFDLPALNLYLCPSCLRRYRLISEYLEEIC